MTRGNSQIKRPVRRWAVLLALALAAVPFGSGADLLLRRLLRTAWSVSSVPSVPGTPEVAAADANPSADLVSRVAPAPIPMIGPLSTVPASATATAAPTNSSERRPRNDLPYQFVSRSTTDSEIVIVLFGRGRVVKLSGPGRLDDEYNVDAVFDDYLILCHVPTAVCSFLKLAQQQRGKGGGEALRDPEGSPRD